MAKVVIITGAGRGIGRACAVKFAKAGWGVVGVARTASELEETGGLCGEGFKALSGSVTDEALAGRAVELAGRVDAVIHCAGVAPLKPVEETSVGLFRNVVETNLTGGYVFVKAAWESLKVQGGAVVMISSMASRDPFAGFSAYAAAKAGVNGLVLALDREGKAFGVRAYGVAPGAVETAMFRELMTPEQYPTEKALRPEEVAEVVWQCVSGAMVYSGGETVFMSKL